MSERIAYIVQGLPPVGFAGSDVYASDFLAACHKAGHMTCAVVAKRSLGMADIIDINETRCYMGMSRTRDIRIELERWKPTVIVCQYVTAIPGIQLAEQMKIPCIAVVHSMDGWDKVVSVGYNRFTSILFTSNVLRNQCGHPANSSVLHPPISIDRVKADQCVGFGGPATIINYSFEKGGVDFWNAANKLPAIKFNAVHGGYGKQFIGSNSGNVSMVARTNNIENVYADTGVLVFQSHHETFGMVGVEAQANGIPVIASDIPELHEALGDGALYIKPKSTAELVAALRSLYGCPQAEERYEKLAKAGLENFKRFSDSAGVVNAAIGSAVNAYGKARLRPVARPVAASIPVVAKPVKVAPQKESNSGKRQLLSVIMAAYKAEKCLAEAVEAILSQELPDNWELEMLIATDGCRNSFASAIGFVDRRVGIVEIRENVGTYVAANTLIAHSKGDAILRVDADDVLLPTAIHKMLTLLDAKPGVGVTGVFHTKATADLEPIEYKNHISVGTRMFRRSTMDRLGGYRAWSCAADHEIERRCAAMGIVVEAVPEHLYLYRQHEAQLTQTEKWSPIKAERSKKRDRYFTQSKKWELAWRLGTTPPTIRPVTTKNVILHRKLSQKVTISLASIPSRGKTLEKVVSALLPQADQLNVYLNGYDTVPAFLDNEKIDVATSQEHGDRGDAGKFYWVGLDDGYYITCDDDIIYPKNYVARLVAEIEHYEKKAVVGFHGSIFLDKFITFVKSRESFRFGDELKENTNVHVLGTGASGFHQSTIEISLEHFKHPNMADMWLAVEGQLQGVPFICLSRKEGWMKDMGYYDDSIFNHSKKGTKGSAMNTNEIQTALVKKHWPWIKP